MWEHPPLSKPLSEDDGSVSYYRVTHDDGVRQRTTRTARSRKVPDNVFLARLEEADQRFILFLLCGPHRLTPPGGTEAYRAVPCRVVSPGGRHTMRDFSLAPRLAPSLFRLLPAVKGTRECHDLLLHTTVRSSTTIQPRQLLTFQYMATSETHAAGFVSFSGYCFFARPVE